MNVEGALKFNDMFLCSKTAEGNQKAMEIYINSL